MSLIDCLEPFVIGMSCWVDPFNGDVVFDGSPCQLAQKYVVPERDHGVLLKPCRHMFRCEITQLGKLMALWL